MKNLAYFFYILLLKKLPSSYTKLGGSFFNKVRCYFVKKIITSAGNNITIDKNANITKDLVIGDFSGIGENCTIGGGTVIGKYVMMGPDVRIYTRNHCHRDTNKPMCFQGFEKKREVVIHDDVWIGARAIILPGVKVGRGSIIGAGSVVTKNVDPYTIVAGNPAKKVKERI